MMRLNLNLDEVRNCKETTTFVKKCKKILNVRRKESSTWLINKKFYLKNPKSFDKFKEMYKKWNK